ncbi:hypothetical protein [Paenibacillus sp. KS1]|uniref:hypothetical protein n=1 Tax=Paenibacillus sp. KS1 TaxID=1849249 RepID=UPI000AA7F9CF|nr:hypothetical protein [Paenibacillus sp. KS1]
MKKLGLSFMMLMIMLGMIAISPANAASSPFRGGLLDDVPIQIGTIVGPSSGTADSKMTDNDTSSTTYFRNESVAWYTFSTPQEISAVVVYSTQKNNTMEFYDSSNQLLLTYNAVNNNGIQSLPSVIHNVSTVVLKPEKGSGIKEWNVFTKPSAAPSPTNITWIQGGDKFVYLEWASTGAKTYTVKRSPSPSGSFEVIASNVTDTFYTDKSVNNGTTYYYAVSSVNEAGESVNSADKSSATPNATKYTGGLLDGLPISVGNSLASPTSTERSMTDNNASTSKYFRTESTAWYTFASPEEISSVLVDGGLNNVVEFYDANNKLLKSVPLANNDGIQSLPSVIQNVSTVVLKPGPNSSGVKQVKEWNVYSVPSAAPSPTSITWKEGRDKLVLIEWVQSGAKSYNVKRSNSSGGKYFTIASGVSGTSFTDRTVDNGTTYYYVVSAVNEVGESGDSKEISVTPNATKYTGGLLDGVHINVGDVLTKPKKTVREYTDNDPSTGSYIANGEMAWYSFASPVEVSAVILHANALGNMEFYDVNNNLLYSYKPLVNDKVETLPEKIKNVTTVVLKYSSGTRIMEWNVFGESAEQPNPASIQLTATGGNKKVSLHWNSTNSAPSYNIMRSTVAGGSYKTIATVTGSTYDYVDSLVTNGTIYYYVVTAVSPQGEIGQSNEASATPNSVEVTPPGTDEDQYGNRALLNIVLNNGISKEFDLSMKEVNAFIAWYEGRASGNGSVMFAFDKHNNNKGPFKNRKEYVFFDKIITFEVNGYDADGGSTSNSGDENHSNPKEEY